MANATSLTWHNLQSQSSLSNDSLTLAASTTSASELTLLPPVADGAGTVLGLVAHYPFDEIDPAPFLNAITLQTPATPVGSISRVSGKLGTSVGFNSTGHLEIVPIAPALGLPFGGPSAEITVTMWFQAPSSPPAGEEYLLTDFAVAADFGFAISISSGVVTAKASSNGSAWNVSLSDTLAADGAWHFLAAVWDVPGGEIRLSVDGSTLITTALTSVFASTAGKLMIGGANSASPTGRLTEGRIDEIGLHRAILEQVEVDDLWNSSAGKAYRGEYYDIQQDSGGKKSSPFRGRTLIHA